MADGARAERDLEPRVCHEDGAGSVVRDPPAQDIGLAEEVRHEQVARRLVDLERRAALHDPARLEHDDAVGEREGLLLVVCHQDRRDAQLALQRADLVAHLLAEARVEVRERLVEQQHSGFRTSERASATRCCCPPESCRGYGARAP